jgi:cytochrome c peroxidase
MAALAGCGGGSSVAACDLEPSLDAGACAALHAMALPPALPPSPGNAKADDIDAAYLGFTVFFDARFSANQNVRCASCHLPEQHFDDALATSRGIARVTRNSPTMLNAARVVGGVFWDGRADSLWSQALFPLEDPREMGSSRLQVAHTLAKNRAGEYAKAFGPLPALDDPARFPPAGKPGDPAWEQMSASDQATVNRIVANLGKAFEAYERKLATGPAAFDRFLAGDASGFSDAARRGMAAFATLGCPACHAGPNLSDGKFHNLGIAAAPGADPDRGRSDAIATLNQNPFNLGGPYADGAPGFTPAVASPSDLGAFRTPTLRNVALTAPYGHNGSFARLEDVVVFHLQGGGRGQGGFVGAVDPALQPRSVTPEQLSDLLAFLGALNGSYPPLPWNSWPGQN